LSMQWKKAVVTGLGLQQERYVLLTTFLLKTFHIRKKRVGFHELGSGWIDKNHMEPDSPFRSA